MTDGCKTPPTKRLRANPTPSGPSRLSDQEVADRLRLPVPELCRAAAKGTMPPPTERGTTWYWRAEDIDEWVATECPLSSPDGQPYPAEAQDPSSAGTYGHSPARSHGDEQPADVPGAEDLMTYRQAMRPTGLKKTALYKLFDRDPSLGHRAGPNRGRIFFYRSAVERYLREGRRRPAEELPRPPARRPRPRRATAAECPRLKFLG
jgi:predicted DNA-binding transcriptional regulator AlpA